MSTDVKNPNLDQETTGKLPGIVQNDLGDLAQHRTSVPDNTAPHTLPAIPPVTVDGLKELLAKVGTNPAQLEFPTDKWGFTSAVRKEVLKAASTVYGQDDKHDLLIGTLAILIRHVQTRKAADKLVREKRFEEQDAARGERLHRERVSAPAVPDPVTV
jgi:hypothetical protein